MVVRLNLSQAALLHSLGEVFYACGVIQECWYLALHFDKVRRP